MMDKTIENLNLQLRSGAPCQPDTARDPSDVGSKGPLHWDPGLKAH